MSKVPLVGVGAVCSQQGKVLLLHRANVHGAGSWGVPGGHLDFGETPQACALREFHEETGLLATNPRFIAITSDIFPEVEKHYITVFIQVDYTGGEPTLDSPWESDQIAWFDWQHLPQPLFLPFSHLLTGNCLPEQHAIQAFLKNDLSYSKE